jgi:hypothetical protein
MLQYKICCSKSVCLQGGVGPTGFVPYTALKLEQAYLSPLCLVQLQITFWGVAPPPPILQPHEGTYAIQYCTHPHVQGFRGIAFLFLLDIFFLKRERLKEENF